MTLKLSKLSQQEARKILENANLPGTINRDLKFAISSKSERLKVVRNSKDKDDTRTAAAIEIQRVWRGYHARCKLFGILHPSISSMSTIPGTRVLPSAGRMSDVHTPTPTPPHTTPQPQFPQVSTIMTDRYKKYCDQRVAEEGISATLMSFTEFCASVIQHWWRQQQMKPRNDYPTTPPPTTRGEMHSVTPGEETTPEADSREGSSAGLHERRAVNMHQAAKIVQRAWRRHIDIQVYKYYRDLISFRGRGDPSLMLRCINPRESSLLDAGAGVHIKFRLAGFFKNSLKRNGKDEAKLCHSLHSSEVFTDIFNEKFPPNIYYKVFTHRNVADIGAFAPRDYTQAVNKDIPASFVHNKGHDLKQDIAETNWYKRWENNGWRIVSDRIVQRVDQDPVVFNSSHNVSTFHHSKIIRKADLEKKRKKKKIDWMKKMYKQGMLQAKGVQDPDTQRIIETVAQGMVTAADTRGYEAVEDWEVDELLEWTSGLNFDQYLGDWKEFATSAGSEFLSTQTNYLPDDPFSLTVTSR